MTDEMNTAPGHPGYLIFDEVEWDVPEFANGRIRGLFIGFTTLSDEIDLFSLNVAPADNSNHEFLIATTSSNPDTINQGVPPTAAGIFKIRWDFDFVNGVDDRRGGCAILGNEVRLWSDLFLPGGLTPQNELSILAPVTREMIGRTRESTALKALPVPPWPPASGSGLVDTITRVRWRSRPDLLRVRVVGVVTPRPGLFMPSQVELWIPGQLDAAGTGCTGTLFETRNVDDLITGDFARTTPRLTFPANPGTVCVRSPNGGAAEEIAIEKPN